MIRNALIFALVLANVATATASAQRRTLRPAQAPPSWEPKKEISVFGGYMFWGSIDAVLGATPGRLQIEDAGSYGMAFDFPVRPGMMAEFLYMRQPTELYFKPVATGIREKLFDMHVAYYQLGGLYEVPKGRARPFGSLGVGVTHFNPKDARYGSEWRLSFNVGVGARVFLAEQVGLRGQFNLFVPVNFYGGGMWCGPGGCSVGGTATAIAQGSFTGGLVVAF